MSPARGSTAGRTPSRPWVRSGLAASATSALCSSPSRRYVTVTLWPGAVPASASATEAGEPIVRPAVEPRAGDIRISLGDVGGPSAGLMFALAVVDKLSPGELTGGRFVAGTGAIDAAGDVSPIGGIPFKMRAARDAGATVFLVPDDNCAEAAATAPDGLQLVRVSGLRDAVGQLEALNAGAPVTSC